MDFSFTNSHGYIVNVNHNPLINADDGGRVQQLSIVFVYSFRRESQLWIRGQSEAIRIFSSVLILEELLLGSQ